MLVAVGVRLGPYEVTGALGAGGMGEVYRARDTRIGRDVAIKVLPASFADDADRLRRFEQEARTVGALNHPNLLVLFDVGRHDGSPYLVSELLEGETLRSRLARMPLGVHKALDFGVQIAHGLAAAHEKGIVHRDLKPENLFVTHEGRVKILDFGLARVAPAARKDEASAETASSPTEPGVLLGTLGYMSPEQVRGQPADHRADVFAFGAVLYEMVTGTRAFRGDSAADTAAAILHREPPELSGRSKEVAPALERILRRCLEKDPAERFQSASDLAFALEAFSRSPLSGSVAAEGISSARGRRTWVWAGAALIALAVAVLVGPRLRRAPDRKPAPVIRTLISVAPAEALAGIQSAGEWIGGVRTSLAFSADGRRLAFVGRRSERWQLYVRELDQERATPLPGTEGVENPFFSPDGEWVGFWARGRLFKIALRGGPPVALCSLPGDPIPIFGASWGSQRSIVFAGAVGGLWQCSSEGGEPKPLTKLEAGEVSHRLPQVLPGGEAILYTAKTVPWAWTDARIVAESLRTGERRSLVEDAADARYVASGHLVFLRRGSLMAVPFDAARLEVTGGVFGLASDVAQAAQLTNARWDSGAGQFSVTSSGALAYVPGGPRPLDNGTLVRVDRRGALTPLSTPHREYGPARSSPDGRRVATDSRDENGVAIWLFDVARSTMTPFERGFYALWSPNGHDIVFSREPSTLLRRPADPTEQATRLVERPLLDPTPSSWSPDGTTLAFVQATPTSGGARQRDVLLLDLRGQPPATRPLLATASEETHPEFSPDGRWLAYVSDVSGRREVYVQPYPGPGPRLQVSIEGGTCPAWSSNGRELFYLTLRTKEDRIRMMSAELGTTPSLLTGTPRVLFEYEHLRLRMNCEPVRCYDVAPDGRGFLAAQRDAPPPTAVVTHINLVLNWLEELSARAPSGR